MAGLRKPRPGWLTEKIAGMGLGHLQARSREDEMGCWIWANKLVEGRCVAMFTHGRAARWRLDARRLAFELANDFEPPSEMRCLCPENSLCVKPSHMRVTREVHSPERRRKTGLAIAKARRKNSRYTDDVVRDIRNSPESIRQAAARVGMSYSLAALIRQGKARRELSGPFVGLGEGWRA